MVKPFDPNLETVLMTDASRLFGIGYCLLQRHSDSHLYIVDCGSQSLNQAQKNYATIELECMAIQWAIIKCHYYLRCHPGFKVITDHQPLLGIFEKPLGEITNTRLARFRERLVGYNFKILWGRGKDHEIADALSRAPVFAPPEEDHDEEQRCLIARAAEQDNMFTMAIAGEKDHEYQALKQALQEGRTRKEIQARSDIAAYASVWEQLSILEGREHTLVIMDGNRVIVPGPARREILQELHRPHCGIIKTYENARQLYHWPGMKNAIAQMTQQCSACQESRPSLAPEPFAIYTAEWPMQTVGTDLFDLAGKKYLVMVDRFSGFPWVAELRNTTTEHVTNTMRGWFLAVGYPASIRSDGGPQFRDKFRRFCDDHGIKHELASAYHPESNGLAEAAVGNIKALLKKCMDEREDFSEALLAWRNTPRADGISPAQAFFGRRLRGRLPTMAEHMLLKPFDGRPTPNRHTERRELDILRPGDKVMVQDPQSKAWNTTGTIVEARNDSNRSYTVDIGGKMYIRNRIFLRPSYASITEKKECGQSMKAGPEDMKHGQRNASTAVRRSTRIQQKLERK